MIIQLVIHFSFINSVTELRQKEEIESFLERETLTSFLDIQLRHKRLDDNDMMLGRHTMTTNQAQPSLTFPTNTEVVISPHDFHVYPDFFRVKTRKSVRPQRRSVHQSQVNAFHVSQEVKTGENLAEQGNCSSLDVQRPHLIICEEA